ncbi:hypothetical protein R1sor_019603 [Riccia sorocarpa]|uniref:Uncharacterized protein n=1 Tax=Riccia sorocarpa TaxID=122646 RepID=A0ABD3IE29_9MARC
MKTAAELALILENKLIPPVSPIPASWKRVVTELVNALAAEQRKVEELKFKLQVESSRTEIREMDNWLIKRFFNSSLIQEEHSAQHMENLKFLLIKHGVPVPAEVTGDAIFVLKSQLATEVKKLKNLLGLREKSSEPEKTHQVAEVAVLLAEARALLGRD